MQPGPVAISPTATVFARQRYAVIPEDIYAMAYPVLRHRILMNFKAEAEGITSDQATAVLLKAIERPATL